MKGLPVPRISQLPRTRIAGIDAGGTKTHMRYVNPVNGDIMQVQARSADYGSLQELFCHCFEMAGCVPEALVAAVAGRPSRDGNVKITNHPQWPVFRREDFARELGITLTTINDLVGTAVGISCLDESEYELLTPGTPAADGPARLAISVGTGVGSASVDPEGAVHPSESGHISWQPVTALEEDYLRSLQRLNPGIPVSVESSIGGLHGFDRLYDFMITRKKPSPYIQEHVDRYRREHRGIGSVITAAAVSGDGCCCEIMRLFGSIFGQYLRCVVLTSLSQGGSIWLTSSVLQAPGIAEFLMSDSAFHERLLSVGAEHSDLMQQLPIYLVTERDVAVRGAFELTRRMTEAG